MIEKMAYVSVLGPKDDFDRITDGYLANYEIHLENAVLRMTGQEFISPFTGSNPYKDLLTKSGVILELLKNEDPGDDKKKKNSKKAEKKEKKGAGNVLTEMPADEACALVVSTYESLNDHVTGREQLLKEREELSQDLESVSHFKGLGYKLEDIFGFDYIASRFGRIPAEGWNYFLKNADESVAGLFTKCQADREYVWGVYFAPKNETAMVDGEFASLRFENTGICDKYQGTPDEICKMLQDRIDEINKEIDDHDKGISELTAGRKDELLRANEKLEELSHNFDARKYAGCIEQPVADGVGDASYFVICGWMRTADAEALKKDTADDGSVICIIDEAPELSGKLPPTSLKNPKIFKPYELYTEMYGLPSYNEYDPTKLIAILYSFIFGAMFGDLGHGLVLLIGGLLLYRLTTYRLTGIIAFAGVFSCIFGLLYGSFFGFEDIIPTLWLKPREAMSTLNFIGRLNTIFAIAVAFGMVLTLALMVINVISHIKRNDFIESVFSANGIAGFLFYGSICGVAVLYLLGKTLPATALIIAAVGIPLLAIAVEKPVLNAIKKRKIFETGIGMYFVETFFELFETLLAYFSNTLSYVRIGAFAVSHAAMMEVVLSLTGYADGQGSIIGLIFGNLFVIGFEGLVVGIQVLRLQYYEIFSRFYIGEGREFKSFFKSRRSF